MANRLIRPAGGFSGQGGRAGAKVACLDLRLENAEETARLAGQGALAVQCAAQNIRVNTLSPGGVETDRLLRFGSMEKAREILGPKHLLKRLG